MRRVTSEGPEEVAVSESQPISWRSIVYGTPVVSGDDAPVGVVAEVLGSDAEDVFHGLRVRLAVDRRDVMISANDVASMSADEIRSDLTRAEIERLPAFDEHGQLSPRVGGLAAQASRVAERREGRRGTWLTRQRRLPATRRSPRSCRMGLVRDEKELAR